MAARGKNLTLKQKNFFLKLKSEGNSGSKLEKYLELTYLQCHFLKRNENKKILVCWLKVQGNQNVVEKDGALTEDFSILLNQTVEGLYQIFLPCTMKIHHRNYQSVQFKEGYIEVGFTGELLRRLSPF